MNKQILAGKPKSEIGPWDIAIIGSGPAALTAAIYTTRGAASTIILGGHSWGGQLMLTTEVDNFPAHPGTKGPDLMAKMREHATMFGAEFIAQNVSEIDISSRPFRLKTNDRWLTAKSVIIATGAETRWLDAPGVSKLIGRGVSSCAPCDAPFFKGKKVAVVGGGDAAMEEAMVLTKYASEVIVIHRRNEFRASAIMQKKVMNNPKIRILWNTEVVEAKGESKLESLSLSDGTSLEVDGVFIAIGHIPSTMIFKGKVDLDEMGYIVRNSKFQIPNSNYSTATSVDGVFTAGDVHDYHYRQAITAAAFGCMAGLDTLSYLADHTD